MSQNRTSNQKRLPAPVKVPWKPPTPKKKGNYPLGAMQGRSPRFQIEHREVGPGRQVDQGGREIPIEMEVLAGQGIEICTKQEQSLHQTRRHRLFLGVCIWAHATGWALPGNPEGKGPGVVAEVDRRENPLSPLGESFAGSEGSHSSS